MEEEGRRILGATVPVERIEFRRSADMRYRRQAYENLAKRTDLEGVKSVCVALQQAERYGTLLGQTLRVMAQETATCACRRPRKRKRLRRYKQLLKGVDRNLR